MQTLSRRRICKRLFLRGSQFLTGIFSVSFLSFQSRSILGFSSQLLTSESNILTERGNFLEEIRRIKKLALPKNSHLYQIPTTTDLDNFRVLASSLISQDINTAANKANALNYEIVKFIDNSSGQVFYGLRERHVLGYPIRGWGSYFINPTYSSNALVEVPHVLFDKFSEEIGAKAFLGSAARGFLVAGAHRDANGTGSADVCNPINSIFQEVHKAWTLSQTKTWQIHGFSISEKPSFPSNTQSVLSDGQGRLSTEVMDLSQRMRLRSFITYVYNELSASDMLNQQVNQGVAGQAFTSLGGTQNVQGIYCRSVGTAFTHIELEKSIRDSSTNRDLVSRSIAESIQAIS
jgi:hypothetical protein